MRFTSWLSATHSPKMGRHPQPPNKTPFQEILPLKLKERVSGKSDKAREGGCLLELYAVINCLQKHEYENKLCQNVVNKFNNCYSQYLVNRHASKKAKERGLLVPGEKNLTYKQIKQLFIMRPIQ